MSPKSRSATSTESLAVKVRQAIRTEFQQYLKNLGVTANLRPSSEAAGAAADVHTSSSSSINLVTSSNMSITPSMSAPPIIPNSFLYAWQVLCHRIVAYFTYYIHAVTATNFCHDNLETNGASMLLWA